MSNIKGKIQYLSKFPFPIIFQKIVNNLFEGFYNKDFRKNSLTEQRGQANNLIFRVSTFSFNHKVVSDKKEIHHFLINKYLNHRLDLLGSGWVDLGYAVEAPGLEDFQYSCNLAIPIYDAAGDWLKEVVHPNHLAKSKAYWQIISAQKTDYQPIDWQKDFKSGHRWTATKWFKKQQGAKGADIKNVLELARLQHLPLLALSAQTLPNQTEEICYELKHQLLDFFAANPPSMGTGYIYAMDVGIRVTNIIVAFDIISQLKRKDIFDAKFEEILLDNLYLHGLHILNDLEKKEGGSNNHYLANIVGLLFIATYLEGNKELDQWLAFAIQELIYCMDYQYFADGSNFEGSTFYHRLSTEMMLYASALVIGLSQAKRAALTNYTNKGWRYKIPLKKATEQKFTPNTSDILPPNFLNKLFKSNQFLADITKENGEMPQFGDNDSGRFLKLMPLGTLFSTQKAITKYQNLKNYGKLYAEETYFDENQLRSTAILSAALAIFPNAPWASTTLKTTLDFQLAQNLAQQKTIATPIIKRLKNQEIYPTQNVDQLINKYQLTFHQTTEIYKETSLQKSSLLENIKLVDYPDFQLWCCSSNRIYLAISGTSSPKQHPSWGHIHNDKLSFELAVDGIDLIVDPGTYLYSPLPARRNEFRSTKVHNIAYVEGEEQNEPLAGYTGLFALKRQSTIQLLEKTPTKISFLLTYRKITQIRTFELLDHRIILRDYSNYPFTVHLNRFHLYSNGYGKRLN